MNKKDKFDSLDYYALLEASPMTSEDDLRQKYRELAKFWHPDYNKADNAVDMFQKISVAYETLKDAKSRLKYTLLSAIYDQSNFPDMNALCILKNIHGQEDINLRAFRLIEITGKGLGCKKIDKIYFCSQYEASGVIRNITKHNWCYGFWGIDAFFKNIVAIVKNIRLINNPKDNLMLLIHNALAYESEGKTAEAATLATLAKNYANKNVCDLLDMYIELLGDVSVLSVKKWNFDKLRYIQLVFPIAISMAILTICGTIYLKNQADLNNNTVKLKEDVILQNGQKVYSDVAVAKFFDIPIDVYDQKKLYYVIEDTKAMHGADENFDVFKIVNANTTVRQTGRTADNKWFRVMFDNGEMAFIKADKLRQGIGNEIPLWSKIYKEK